MQPPLAGMMGYAMPPGDGGVPPGMMGGMVHPHATAFMAPQLGQQPGGGRPASHRRPGDWDCPTCSHHNFASRVQCLRCATPRPGSEGSEALAAATAAAAAAAAAPSIDYCQHYVDSGERPQNFVRDAHMEDVHQDHPALRQLSAAKAKQVVATATPPMGLRLDLRATRLSPQLFGTKFDVVLLDPPWEECRRRAPGSVPPDMEAWRWEDVRQLDIPAIADTPSFVFMWAGSSEGLDGGRHCLRSWGFKRVEEICWVKTNTQATTRPYLSAAHQEAQSVLVHTKEHCLVGMRGSLRRNTESHVAHANLDVDVIVTEEPPLGSTAKPSELYDIIERFANGRRRLELFGGDNNLRPGWVTVGRDISTTTFSARAYAGCFRNPDGTPYLEHRGVVPDWAPTLVPTTAEIEELRPRSPPPPQRVGRGR